MRIIGLEKDFYEEVASVVEDSFVKGKWIIYKWDSKKGHRIIHYDFSSGAIYREEKSPLARN